MSNIYRDFLSLPPEAPRRDSLATLKERLDNLYVVIVDECGDEPIEDHPSGLWAKGALLGDIHRILLREVSETEINEAAVRLWTCIGKLGNPNARRLLWRTLDQDYTRATLMHTAVYLVQEFGKTPQRMRFGRKYLLDEAGNPDWLVPDDLTVEADLLEWWVTKEIKNAIESVVLDETYPKRKEEPPSRSSNKTDMALTLLPPLDATEVDEFLERLIPLLTKMELKTLPYAMQTDPRLTHREIAELIGSRKPSVAQFCYQIRKKARRLQNPR